MKNEKIANVNVTLKDMFMKWLSLTSKFHKLRNQEQQLLSLILYYHHIYKREITNNKILWKIVFDYDTKMKIKNDDIFKKELTDASLQNLFTSLRKKNVIVNGEVSPVYIPDIEDKAKRFKVIFNFNIVDNE